MVKTGQKDILGLGGRLEQIGNKNSEIGKWLNYNLRFWGDFSI